MFSELPSGILGDIFKKKTIVLYGLLILILTPLITVSASLVAKKYVFFVLIMSFVLEGIGNALLSGADDALFYEGIRKEGNEKQYDKIRGNMQLISSIILGIATFSGGFLYTLNFDLPYIFQSITFVIASIIILNTKEIKKESLADKNYNLNNSESTFIKSLKNVLSVFKEMVLSPNIFFLFIFTIITVSVVNAIFALLPDYISKIGFNSAENGIIFMIYSLFGGIIATQAYRLSKLKYSNLSMLVSAILIISAVLQIQNNKIIFLIGAGLLYIVVDILDPIVMQMLNLWVRDNARATFISGLSFAISLITMVVNPLIGLVVQRYGTINMLTITSSVTVFLIFISYLLILGSKKKEKYTTEN
ncbi:MFS transporter [Companilactobacillus sp. FL22-1]|uniref:MFS transporter n=1 Tax=Companilactobacillus sp. FL22-1 TaxID=3373892 RepID=UPI00375438CC